MATAEAQKPKAIKRHAIDYHLFAFDQWTPGRVKFCLAHWTAVEEAAANGIECREWPPLLGSESIAQAYPKNMNILTTAADMQIALRGLPAREARALWAYYRLNMTQAQVGRYLDCSQPTAYRAIRDGEELIVSALCGADE